MPRIDPEALQSLIWEIDGSQSSPHLDPHSDDGASAILDHARRSISTLRFDASLHLWFLGAVSIAAATAVMLAGVYGDFISPIEVWYDWPLVWVASYMLVAIALTVVFLITSSLHDYWWQHFGGGQRDAQFYADPFARRPGAARPGTQRLPKQM